MEDDDLAVDVVLWTVLAAMAGFIACGCIITRNTANKRQAAMRYPRGGREA
jgi:hypothetical protein